MRALPFALLLAALLAGCAQQQHPFAVVRVTGDLGQGGSQPNCGRPIEAVAALDGPGHALHVVAGRHDVDAARTWLVVLDETTDGGCNFAWAWAAEAPVAYYRKGTAATATADLRQDGDGGVLVNGHRLAAEQPHAVAAGNRSVVFTLVGSWSGVVEHGTELEIPGSLEYAFWNTRLP